MEFKFRASRLSHLDSSTPAVSSRLNTPSRESSILFQSIVTTNPALEQPRLGRPPTQSARLPKGTGKHQKEAAHLAELCEQCDHECEDTGHVHKKQKQCDNDLDPESNSSSMLIDSMPSPAHHILSSSSNITIPPAKTLPHPVDYENIGIYTQTRSFIGGDNDKNDEEDPGEIGLAFQGLGDKDEDDDLEECHGRTGSSK
ncbi:hypothetical protein GYMLUDRAFT_250295 [Collybiopsis luxurians FD-317 M1]|uniref:Uncharacterized protein n=1 Tax=Collybiopsis luxurians FD-317 M1 TaxID=944289 RepID=A0A0D0CF73_9AGAR|nr:hypothetical protein GYMLUDRAFT_250295 [Collybiopsis luxurians FD-317 M1]